MPRRLASLALDAEACVPNSELSGGGRALARDRWHRAMTNRPGNRRRSDDRAASRNCDPCMRPRVLQNELRGVGVRAVDTSGWPR